MFFLADGVYVDPVLRALSLDAIIIILPLILTKKKRKLKKEKKSEKERKFIIRKSRKKRGLKKKKECGKTERRNRKMKRGRFFYFSRDYTTYLLETTHTPPLSSSDGRVPAKRILWRVF